MKQRAVIAMALACDPDVIIADEPTTALDVIVQDRILNELRQIQKQQNISMIYISHDIGLIADQTQRFTSLQTERNVINGLYNTLSCLIFQRQVLY